jgi:ATP-dependent Clp protease ATP-binding subunit ClpC
MPDFLTKRIIAHDSEVSRVASVIQRNFAGFTSSRPVGSFLLLGPTGVGKTECAKVVAEFLFGKRDALTRIDMSEFSEAHSVSRLIGSPPGYVGHEHGGQLTEPVRRRPYQIILLDEVEKANSDVLNVLLQLLDEGHLTDGRGRRVIFEHTVIFLTSNLGHEHFDKQSRAIGFGSGVTDKDTTNSVLESARKTFTPELWNRIDEKLVFGSLSIDDVKQIAKLLLNDSAERLADERQIRFHFSDEVIGVLIERGGYDPRHGARPMRRMVQELVEGTIAQAILEGTITTGDEVTLGVVDGEIEIVSQA